MQSARHDRRLCVSDTSVLTDLDRGSLLEAVFDQPLVFVVPDLLYERELRPYGGAQLLERGLQVAELDGEGVARALNFRRVRPSLSLADTFALALATENRWMLLTGDRVLQNLNLSGCRLSRPAVAARPDDGRRCERSPEAILCAQSDQRSSAVQAASNRGEQTHIPLEGAAY